MLGFSGPRLYLIGTDLYLAGTDLYLVGTRLYLTGTDLYLVGTDLYIVGTDLYLDFLGKVLGPKIQARNFTSKIDVKIRARILGPKTLPRRHLSLPRFLR